MTATKAPPNTPSNIIPAAVVGASGYSGEELLELLAGHPAVKVVCVTSRQHAGTALTSVFPRFAKRAYEGLLFSPADAATIVASGARVAFLALPHGLAAEYAAPLVNAGVVVIDLSADFRLRSADVYQDFYGEPHPAPELLDQAVYGMPEIHRATILEANLIASPGCYPTSIILPLHPLLKARVIDPKSIIVCSMSGVSGAGRKADLTLLFAECNESLRAYGVPKHRHLSEIEQELSDAAGERVVISFAPHLVPVTRGIVSTIHATVKEGVTSDRISDVLHQAYDQSPFVRLLDGRMPDTKHVLRTNFCDIGWVYDPRTNRIVLSSAEDNLCKGAASQAVQSFNLRFGLDETTSLL